MASILVELKCPQHGFERFRVKIVRKFNMASNKIMPRTISKPTEGELNLIYIGRNVNYEDVKKYLINYLDQKGMLEKIVRIQMIV